MDSNPSAGRFKSVVGHNLYKMRDFVVSSFAMMMLGFGMENFPHTWYGTALTIIGFAILIEITIRLYRKKDKWSPLYILQFWMCFLGLSQLTNNKTLSLIIVTIAGIGGFYIIISSALKQERLEKEKEKL